MNLFVKFFYLILLCSPHVMADQAVQKRIKQEKKRIEQRYESFYQHQKEKKQDLRRRRAGIEALKKKRRQERESYEKARKQFIKDKKSNKSSSLREKLEAKYQARLKRKKKKYNKNRQEYVNQQKALENLKSKARRVSLEAQLGLEKSD